MLKKPCFLLFLFCCLNIAAQQKDSLSTRNGIDRPSLLTTHHFGIFSARINQNFKLAPPNKTTLTLNTSSGNNFQPFVEGYYPKDPAIREQFSNTVWYARSFRFIDQASTPADYINILIDAVIKEFRVDLNIPLSKQQELGITLRSYLITKGKHPFSFFTGDETIEWFHSNIAGGEDPYGRRFYGLNQVNFLYNDRYGNTLELNNNDFFIGGLEFNYFYYPKLPINESRHIFINLGSHLGINTSKYNASLDFGASVNVIKKYNLKNSSELNFGSGFNILRKNIITFNNDIDLGNNSFLGTLEGNIEFAKYTKKGNYNAFSVNYQIQSSYFKRSESDYYHLRGNWQDINGGWQNGVATMHVPLSNWSFIYTYGKPNFKLSFYFKEDFEVNNAPDFQTGLSLKLPVFK